MPLYKFSSNRFRNETCEKSGDKYVCQPTRQLMRKKDNVKKLQRAIFPREKKKPNNKYVRHDDFVFKGSAANHPNFRNMNSLYSMLNAVKYLPMKDEYDDDDDVVLHVREKYDESSDEESSDEESSDEESSDEESSDKEDEGDESDESDEDEY